MRTERILCHHSLCDIYHVRGLWTFRRIIIIVIITIIIIDIPFYLIVVVAYTVARHYRRRSQTGQNKSKKTTCIKPVYRICFRSIFSWSICNVWKKKSQLFFIRLTWRTSARIVVIRVIPVYECSICRVYYAHSRRLLVVLIF